MTHSLGEPSEPRVKLVLTEDEIRAGVARMAGAISSFYGQQHVTIVGVLTGSVILLADLVRQLNMPLRLALVQASSYRGRATRPGPLAIDAEHLPELAGRHVLLLDDIFDTGHTLQELVSQLRRHEPESIRTAVLLRKQGRQQVELEPDWVGFDIPDEFVVGYGLDYDDLYRNLPCLMALEAADLAAWEPLA